MRVWWLILSWQVNIDHRTREKTKQSLEAPSPSSLNEVQAKVYSLMERDSYPRFLRSKMYQDMVNRAHAQGQRRSVWPNLMEETRWKKWTYSVNLSLNLCNHLWILWICKDGGPCLTVSFVYTSSMHAIPLDTTCLGGQYRVTVAEDKLLGAEWYVRIHNRITLSCDNSNHNKPLLLFTLF